MNPTAISLFSGIGALDLAAALAGFDIRAQVEIEPFCQQILTKWKPVYWPNAELHHDVKSVGAEQLPTVELIFGGFPCQDISNAGAKAGIKEGTRSGLWFHFARIIGELRPRYILLENVAAITRRDGVRVVGSLAALGYDAAWAVVPASAVGAPHQRDRWFCIGVAHSNAAQQRGTLDTRAGGLVGQSGLSAEWQKVAGRSGFSRKTLLVDSGSAGLSGHRPSGFQSALALPEQSGSSVADSNSRRGSRVRGAAQPSAQSMLCRVANGIAVELDRNRGLDAKPDKTRSDQILFAVRRIAHAQTVQRHAGKHEYLSSAEVLRCQVHGTPSAERRTNTRRLAKTSREIQRRCVPAVRGNRTFGYTPPRRQSRKQRIIQPHDLVRILSHKMALGAWQETAQKTVGLQNLREAIKEIRSVSKTLCQIEATWRSLHDYEKEWVAIRACQGRRLMWPAAPGQEQHAFEPPRTVRRGEITHRVARLKALGNAVVPQQALPFMQAIYADWKESEDNKGATS